MIMVGALRVNREGNHKIIYKLKWKRHLEKNLLTFGNSQKGRNLRRISTT